MQTNVATNTKEALEVDMTETEAAALAKLRWNTKKMRLSNKVEELRSYHENIATMPPIAEHILRELQREIIILTAELVLDMAEKR